MDGYGRARRRGWAGVIAAAVMAMLVVPTAVADDPPPGANERWEGTWRYHNEFGKGTMELCEVRKDGHPFVFGVYGNEDGGGKIWGVLTNRRTVWGSGFGGTYLDTTKHEKGQFFAIWEGAEFTGKFRTCRTCKRYGWNGERLDRDPAGRGC